MAALEAEATQFAAELLMPKWWMRRFWSGRRRLDQMAGAFDVSMATARNRLRELGMTKR